MQQVKYSNINIVKCYAYSGARNGLSRPPKRSCPDSFLPPSPPPNTKQLTDLIFSNNKILKEGEILTDLIFLVSTRALTAAYCSQP